MSSICLSPPRAALQCSRSTSANIDDTERKEISSFRPTSCARNSAPSICRASSSQYYGRPARQGRTSAPPVQASGTDMSYLICLRRCHCCETEWGCFARKQRSEQNLASPIEGSFQVSPALNQTAYAHASCTRPSSFSSPLHPRRGHKLDGIGSSRCKHLAAQRKPVSVWYSPLQPTSTCLLDW
jgi:hypothetical protein